MKTILLIGVLAVSLSRAQTPNASADLRTFAAWLPGYYHTSERVPADTNQGEARLYMVPIWPEAPDGYWFYLEQAPADRSRAPYRQAVLHLTLAENGQLLNRHFTLRNRALYAGAHRDRALRNELTPDCLSPVPTNLTYFHRHGDRFLAGTDDGSALPPGTEVPFFSSVSSLTARQVIGGHSNGTRSGYVFDKLP
jgi:hypothetical protein